MSKDKKTNVRIRNDNVGIVGPVRVRWIRLSSPSGIVRALRSVIARDNRVKARRIVLPADMVDSVRRCGMWAFVEVKRKVAVVRYWHDGRRTKFELTVMLGHELGHAMGKRVSGYVAEERRADQYGRVAAAVMEHLGRCRR